MWDVMVEMYSFEDDFFQKELWNRVCGHWAVSIFLMKSYILRLYVVLSTRQKHLFQLGVLCSRLSDQLVSLWHDGSVALPERPWNKRREVPLLAKLVGEVVTNARGLELR